MRYLGLETRSRADLLARLAEMPDFLERRFAALPPEKAREPGPGQTFSPVEQCWHLADLEAEGFGERIRRLLHEAEPRLADFDGARIARERRYRNRSLAQGLAAFRAARAANLELLAGVRGAQWSRAGIQEGVGRIMLCDVPAMMAEHDEGHCAEIEAWSAPEA